MYSASISRELKTVSKPKKKMMEIPSVVGVSIKEGARLKGYVGQYLVVKDVILVKQLLNVGNIKNLLVIN